MPDRNNFCSIYGPVNSWRFGKSLGVDLICGESSCSFNCIYCQLGNIVNITSERKIFVETSKVITDFMQSKWNEADVITFSGSGEPTLALNLGEVINQLKKISGKPVNVLTNATMLIDPEVINDLKNVDHISVKLDAANDHWLSVINRSAPGITIEGIVTGIKNLKRTYKGKLSVQSMIMPVSKKFVDDIVLIINEIKPDILELNTPKRGYPLTWQITNREHSLPHSQTRRLKRLIGEEMEYLAKSIQEKTNIPVIIPF